MACPRPVLWTAFSSRFVNIVGAMACPRPLLWTGFSSRFVNIVGAMACPRPVLWTAFSSRFVSIVGAMACPRPVRLGTGNLRVHTPYLGGFGHTRHRKQIRTHTQIRLLLQG